MNKQLLLVLCCIITPLFSRAASSSTSSLPRNTRRDSAQHIVRLAHLGNTTNSQSSSSIYHDFKGEHRAKHPPRLRPGDLYNHTLAAPNQPVTSTTSTTNSYATDIYTQQYELVQRKLLYERNIQEIANLEHQKVAKNTEFNNLLATYPLNMIALASIHKELEAIETALASSYTNQLCYFCLTKLENTEFCKLSGTMLHTACFLYALSTPHTKPPVNNPKLRCNGTYIEAEANNSKLTPILTYTVEKNTHWKEEPIPFATVSYPNTK